MNNCLPATGPDAAITIALIALAIGLIVAGVAAVSRSRRATALLLVPLAVLGLGIGAPAGPAQAVDAAVPGFTVVGTWAPLPGSPDLYTFEGVLTPEQQASVEQVIQIVASQPGATFDGQVQVSSLENPTVTLPFSIVRFAAIPSVETAPVNDATRDWILRDLTVIANAHYTDPCGVPFLTTFIYEGPVRTIE